MKFISPRTDYAFKKIFGSKDSKDILISFLNATLTPQEQDRIVDLDILDPWQAPQIKVLKDSFVDVKAKTTCGKEIIIEMQVINLPGFQKRVLYNVAKSYANQLLEGEAFSTLNPVIGLTIVDFTLFPETEKHLTRFLLKEKAEDFTYSGDLELFFIELPKFTKQEQDIETIQDKWIYFLKEADSLEVIPPVLANEPPLCHAFKMAEAINLTKEEVDLLIAKNIYISSHKASLIQAEERGKEKGREEGRNEGKREALKKMVEVMGISEEEARGILGL